MAALALASSPPTFKEQHPSVITVTELPWFHTALLFDRFVAEGFDPIGSRSIIEQLRTMALDTRRRLNRDPDLVTRVRRIRQTRCNAPDAVGIINMGPGLGHDVLEAFMPDDTPPTLRSLQQQVIDHLLKPLGLDGYVFRHTSLPGLGCAILIVPRDCFG
jgi:hypothetical protein